MKIRFYLGETEIANCVFIFHMCDAEKRHI